jgi:hypothetical protein
MIPRYCKSKKFPKIIKMKMKNAAKQIIEKVSVFYECTLENSKYLKMVI